MPDQDSSEPKIPQPERNPRHLVALLLSVIPGAGHIYKGHTITGLLFMAGTLLVIFAALVYLPVFGPLLIPLYWIWVMAQAYFIEDRHYPDDSGA